MTQRDQARLLLHNGNMLVAKTQFENAPVEEALSMLEQAKQLATELDDEQLIADALNDIGFAHYVASNNRRVSLTVEVPDEPGYDLSGSVLIGASVRLYR